MALVRILPRHSFCTAELPAKVPSVRKKLNSVIIGRARCSINSEQHVIVGAGLAGIATAYLLLQSARSETAVHVVVYDVGSIGNGASGAAAGLLHPFQPRLAFPACT